METLKYKLIKSKAQYQEYCKTIEELVVGKNKSKTVQDEIDLLTLLIEKWDDEHNSFNEVDPIQLLLSFMEDHHLKPKDISEILNMSKGYVSDILHYRKGLSKEVIRVLSEYFKVSQEAFNRSYKIKTPAYASLKPIRVKKTTKQLVAAH